MQYLGAAEHHLGRAGDVHHDSGRTPPPHPTSTCLPPLWPVENPPAVGQVRRLRISALEEEDRFAHHSLNTSLALASLPGESLKLPVNLAAAGEPNQRVLWLKRPCPWAMVGRVDLALPRRALPTQKETHVCHVMAC